MRINRNNYEMYFLLYVDKELSAQERHEVETFAGANADLAAELDTLMKTRMHSPAHLVFYNKELLYKTAVVQIDETNYEDYFLQYIDNELSTEQKIAVEKFIVTHSQYAEELTILKQTVLPEEQISFVNKHTLYRTEQPERRVIPFKPLSLAIAAALIGVTAMVWWLVPVNKNNNPIAVAVDNPAATIQQKPQVKTPVIKPNIEVIAAQNTGGKKQLPGEEKVTTKKEQLKTFATTTNKSLEKEGIAISTRKDDPKQVVIIPQVKEQPQVISPVIASTSMDVNSNNIKNEILKPLIETDIDKTKASEAAYAAVEKNSLIQPAVYKELDTDDDDSQTLYVGALGLNKDKVKGFLKKATRLFGGKAKTETTDNNGKL